MQFTVKSNHSMDKNCLKFIPIALFSCRYKCKKKGKNATAEQNFTTCFSACQNTQNRKINLVNWSLSCFMREQTRSNCVQKCSFENFDWKITYTTQEKQQRKSLEVFSHLQNINARSDWFICWGYRSSEVYRRRKFLRLQICFRKKKTCYLQKIHRLITIKLNSGANQCPLWR